MPVLELALSYRPDDATCWTNLVIPLQVTGRLAAARDAVATARGRGIAIDPEILKPSDGLSAQE